MIIMRDHINTMELSGFIMGGFDNKSKRHKKHLRVRDGNIMVQRENYQFGLSMNLKLEATEVDLTWLNNSVFITINLPHNSGMTFEIGIEDSYEHEPRQKSLTLFIKHSNKKGKFNIFAV